MSNNSINSIQQALVTLVSGVTQLQQVATGRSTDPSSGFPFCRVYFDGLGGDWQDQVSFYASYTFVIEVLQELTAKSKADAEADLQGAVYPIVRALVSGWQLSNNADDTSIQVAPAREVNTSQGPAVSMAITLQVKSLIY